MRRSTPDGRPLDRRDRRCSSSARHAHRAALPGQGTLTDWWTRRRSRRGSGPCAGCCRSSCSPPAAGSSGAGTRPARAGGSRSWAIGIAYVGLVGLLASARSSGASGGRIGDGLAEAADRLVTALGAFVLLVGWRSLGIIVAARDRRLLRLVQPAVGTATVVRATAAASVDGRDRRRRASATAAGRCRRPSPPSARARTQRAKAVPAAPSPGQTGAWGDPERAAIPAAVPSPRPTSSTFAPARLDRRRGAAGAAASARRPAAVRDPRRRHRRRRLAARPRTAIEYILPPIDAPRRRRRPGHAGGDESAHARNEEIIVKKLRRFGDPGPVVGRNAGPVVTQYEVQPAPDVKLSAASRRLSDDLAMALAARSLRIEAPIPGKSAVGIEIPNKDFNVGPAAPVLEESDMHARRAPS